MDDGVCIRLRTSKAAAITSASTPVLVLRKNSRASLSDRSQPTPDVGRYPLFIPKDCSHQHRLVTKLLEEVRRRCLRLDPRFRRSRTVLVAAIRSASRRAVRSSKDLRGDDRPRLPRQPGTAAVERPAHRRTPALGMPWNTRPGSHVQRPGEPARAQRRRSARFEVRSCPWICAWPLVMPSPASCGSGSFPTGRLCPASLLAAGGVVQCVASSLHLPCSG